MPTIAQSDIQPIIDLFKKRGVNFYHACQLKDFETYLQLGGIPSRHLMSKTGLPYTQFDTDDVDKKNSVWDQVFGNLQDYGIPFAHGKRNPSTAPTPTPYGPILIVLNPHCLSEAENTAICLRSAGGMDFDREAESLSSEEEVNKIFHYENIDDAPSDISKSWIKYSTDLRKTFNSPNAMSPEVSCVVQNECISLNHLQSVVIDPYEINGISLRSQVKKLMMDHHLPTVYQERDYVDGREKIIREIGQIFKDHTYSIPELLANKNLSAHLLDWLTRLQKGKMEFFFDRFAKYLSNGTLELLGAIAAVQKEMNTI